LYKKDSPLGRVGGDGEWWQPSGCRRRNRVELEETRLSHQVGLRFLADRAVADFLALRSQRSWGMLIGQLFEFCAAPVAGDDHSHSAPPQKGLGWNERFL